MPLFGSFDRRVRGSIRSMIDEANRIIGDLAEDTGSYLLDVAAIAEQVGTNKWFDPMQWAAYKLSFSADCVPHLFRPCWARGWRDPRQGAQVPCA
jgi:hypothetical protein